LAPAVVHALNILRHLAATDTAHGVSAIARHVGISPSSCFNLLKTLAAEGMVAFDTATKTYRLGNGVDAIARARPDDPVERMAPGMAALAAANGTACGLWRVTPTDRLVLVHFADSETATRIHMTVGQRLPMLIGAMGRCVAAHSGLDDDALARGFAALRWARPPTFARYCREVARARRLGWALDDGDFLHGVTTVAAPVVDAAGTVRYCVANTLFHGQSDEAGLRRLGEATARFAGDGSQMIARAEVR
jgi:DNA-binding IclR family transcriptional regulator